MKYIIDGHFDLLSDVAVRRKNGEHKVIERLYYPAFKKGNVTGIVASLFVDSQYLPYGSVSIALEQIAALHCEISESPELLMLCTCADDFVKAALEKKVGILLSFEGAEPGIFLPHVTRILRRRRKRTGTYLEPQKYGS